MSVEADSKVASIQVKRTFKDSVKIRQRLLGHGQR